MFSEIKKKCFSNQTQIKPLSEKLIQPIHESVNVREQVKEIKPAEKNNKLISCYEEDYTRNTAEIMKYWQRN